MGPHRRARVAGRRAALLAGLACTAVAGVAVGRPGALGALVATALVVGFLWAGAVPLLAVPAGGGGSALAMLVLLTNYGLRLVLVLLVLRVVSRLATVDDRSLGLTVIACALAWSWTHAAVELHRARTR